MGKWGDDVGLALGIVDDVVDVLLGDGVWCVGCVGCWYSEDYSYYFVA